MKIGILQTGRVAPALVDTFGEYPQMSAQFLDGHGFTFEAYAALDGNLPDTPEAADGWLITGSRHGVYEGFDWIAPLEAFIRACFAANRPMVGICFGHQIIAQALGGHVRKYEGGWAVGPQVYDFDGTTRVIHAWHQDQVITPPEGAQSVASNGFCAHAALLYPGQAYTVQAHPEFSDLYTAALIEKRGRGVVPDPILDTAATQIGTALDSPDLAQIMADFLRNPHQTPG